MNWLPDAVATFRTEVALMKSSAIALMNIVACTDENCTQSWAIFREPRLFSLREPTTIPCHHRVCYAW